MSEVRLYMIWFNIYLSKELKQFKSFEDAGKSVGQNRYNLLTQNEREKCVNDLHASVFNSKHYNEIRAHTIGANFDILGFQILISHDLLRSTSIYFCKNAKRSTACNRINFCQLLRGLNNYLWIKHILSDQTIWKPMLLGLLLNMEIDDNVYDFLFTCFMIFVPYFKRKHYQFLMIEHKLHEILTHLIHVFWNKEKQKIIKIRNASTDTHNFVKNIFQIGAYGRNIPQNICNLLVYCRYYCTQKNSTFYASLLRLLRCELLPYTMDKPTIDYCEQLTMNQVNTFYFERIAMNKKKCEWSSCNKSMTNLLLCSGCKLVYYCCKKHQKKHWNLIHRAQCFNATGIKRNH
eukprot:26123_1